MRESKIMEKINLAYRYRIYPDKEQQIMLLNKMKSYNTAWNIALDWYKAYLIKTWLDNNKPMRTSKGGLEYPDFKALSANNISKEIYHLKDNPDCDAWKIIQYKRFIEEKEKYMEYLKNIPATSFHYIYESLSQAFKQNYNPKIIEKRIEQRKRLLKKNQEKIAKGQQPKQIKVYHYKYNGEEYIDNFHLNVHQFSENDCSLTFQQQNQQAIKKCDDGKVYFKVPTIGDVKVIYQRDIPEGSKFDAITISKKGKYWYLSMGGLSKECAEELKPEEIVSVVGIDKNANNHMFYSDGTQFKNPVEKLQKLEKRIAKLKKRDGCKNNPKPGDRKIGSRRYKIVHRQIANIYHKINNIKLNMLHNATAKATDDYGLICLEDQVNCGMSKYNGKYTHKVNHTAFVNQLEYKSKLKGGHIVKVDRWFPSTQLCSVCGKKHEELKNMKIRTLRCDCGNIMNRDYNAAINIRNEGIKVFYNITDKKNFEKISKKFLTNEKIRYIDWVK